MHEKGLNEFIYFFFCLLFLLNTCLFFEKQFTIFYLLLIVFI